MNAVYVVFTCWYCFALVASTGDYHAYVTSDSRLTKLVNVKSATNRSEEKYRSLNPGKFEVKKIKREPDYELLQNEIRQHCKDLYTCVQLKMLVNVSDILKSDTYSLTDGVVLERVVSGDEENSISRVDLEKLKESDNGNFGYITALLVQKTHDIFQTHSLKWSMLPGMDVRIFRNLNYGGRMDAALEVQDREPRTFGGPRKRLMLLLPLVYKMGVMTTLLGGLVVLTLKGLTIGVILLILAVGNLFGKYKHYGHPHPGPMDIHVHVHNDAHGQAYSGWHEEHVDQPTYHVGHHGHYRRWWPKQQQPVPLPYPDQL